jgi:hypothetical protein
LLQQKEEGGEFGLTTKYMKKGNGHKEAQKAQKGNLNRSSEEGMAQKRESRWELLQGQGRKKMCIRH